MSATVLCYYQQPTALTILDYSLGSIPVFDCIFWDTICTQEVQGEFISWNYCNGTGGAGEGCPNHHQYYQLGMVFLRSAVVSYPGLLTPAVALFTCLQDHK